MEGLGRSHPMHEVVAGQFPHRAALARCPTALSYPHSDPAHVPLFAPRTFHPGANPQKLRKNGHIAYTKFSKDWPPSRGHCHPYPVTHSYEEGATYEKHGNHHLQARGREIGMASRNGMCTNKRRETSRYPNYPEEQSNAPFCCVCGAARLRRHGDSAHDRP
jgi:hypothetical protein